MIRIAAAALLACIPAAAFADPAGLLALQNYDRRLSAIGYSRGGRGCFRLDASTGALQFRKIASVDAQGLDELPVAVQRKREVRAYYAPTTYEVIRVAHQAAEKAHGKATPPISLITRPQSGSDDQAHAAICSQVFAEDELYRWLLA